MGTQARIALADAGNELILSVVSVWEMQVKVMLGKLTLRKPLRQLIADQIQQNGISIMPVQLEHALHLGTLPAHHKDPFDRLLIAQALIENCLVVTHDPAFAHYPVRVVW